MCHSIEFLLRSESFASTAMTGKILRRGSVDCRKRLKSKSRFAGGLSQKHVGHDTNAYENTSQMAVAVVFYVVDIHGLQRFMELLWRMG